MHMYNKFALPKSPGTYERRTKLSSSTEYKCTPFVMLRTSKYVHVNTSSFNLMLLEGKNETLCFDTFSFDW